MTSSYIGIIGAGIAGLLSAVTVLNSGFNVDIYEEHRSIGYPRHCTGLVSESTLRSLSSTGKFHVNEVILNKFNEYIILEFPRVKELLEIHFHEDVYLLDRVKVEELLAYRVMDLGGKIYLSTTVKDVTLTQNENAALNSGRGYRKYDLVIVAEGAKRILSRRLGLCRSISNYLGLQAEVVIHNHNINYPLIIVGTISKQMFGWVVPVSDNTLLIGLLDNLGKNIFTKLRKLIMWVSKHVVGREVSIIREYFGGLIPRRFECKYSLGNAIILIGDATSLIKPLTGGGIYSIVHEVNALKNSIINHSVSTSYYSRKLSELKASLRLDAIIKNLLDNIGGYYTIISIFNKITHKVTIDRYDRLLSFKALFSLIKELTQHF